MKTSPKSACKTIEVEHVDKLSSNMTNVTGKDFKIIVCTIVMKETHKCLQGD